MSSLTVWADVTTAAKTDETTEETGAKTGAIAPGELGLTWKGQTSSGRVAGPSAIITVSFGAAPGAGSRNQHG